MEVLSRARVSGATCSVSQRSVCVRESSVPVSVRPLVASVVGSASSLVASSALALNYDEIVRGAEKAATTGATDGFFDFTAVDSFFPIDFDAATDFMSANPVAAVAGLAAVAVPLFAFRALATPQTFGSVSAVEAFNKLSNPEENAQLLDIRAPEDVKAQGTPSLKPLKKRATQVTYTGDANSFLAKVSAKYKDPENTTLYILDR
jgi:chitinase domain-containing protein 1